MAKKKTKNSKKKTPRKRKKSLKKKRVKKKSAKAKASKREETESKKQVKKKKKPKKKRSSKASASATKLTRNRTSGPARSASRKPRKKSLLIGINKYLIPGADLRGCVNDVSNIKNAIETYCGFDSSSIRTLVDTKATTARIRTEIERLTDGTIAGDVLFLHFSGHGSNVPDKSGDEADNRDEILCPADLDWADPLLDDYLREVFSSLARDVNLTVVFDCCHSGSATRGGILPPDTKLPLQRYLPCPLDIMATESGRSLSGKPRGLRARMSRTAMSRGNVKKNVTALNTPEVLISGCTDMQTSADAFIGGKFNGALTYHLVKAIKSRRGKLSYRELHSEALGLIKSAGYNQTPQLSGKTENIDRPFLQPYV